MTKAWFRVYVDVLDEHKVQSLPAELFKTWINVLAVAATTEGVLPALPVLAFRCRRDEPTMLEHVKQLIKAGLIDNPSGGKMIPHNWAARQYQSDSSTERVKRFRKRQRNVSGDVSVTPPDSDSDSDSDDEESTRVRACGSPHPFRLKEGWRPSPSAWAQAKALGISDTRLEIVLGEHVTFCAAGKTPWFEKTADGWDACFIERCAQIAAHYRRKERPNGGARLHKPRKPSSLDRALDDIKSIARRHTANRQ